MASESDHTDFNDDDTDSTAEITNDTDATAVESIIETPSDRIAHTMEDFAVNALGGPLSEISRNNLPISDGDSNSVPTEESSRSLQEETYWLTSGNEKSNDEVNHDQNQHDSSQEEIEQVANAVESHGMQVEQTLIPENEPRRMHGQTNEPDTQPKSNTSNHTPKVRTSNPGRSQSCQRETLTLSYADDNKPFRRAEEQISLGRSNGPRMSTMPRAKQPDPRVCYNQTLCGNPIRVPEDMSDVRPNNALCGSMVQRHMITSVSGYDDTAVSVSHQRRLRRRRRNGMRRQDDGSRSSDEESDGEIGGRLLVVFHLLCVFELGHRDQPYSRQRECIGLTDSDVAFINRFFEINRFRCIGRNNTEFSFSVGNRSIPEVIADLNLLKYRLKGICFSRFCGEVVNGREITRPQDIIISFKLRAVDGTIHDIPSTEMFI